MDDDNNSVDGGDDDDDDDCSDCTDDANDADNTQTISKQRYSPSLHKHIKRKQAQPSYIDHTTRQFTTWFVFEYHHQGP